MFPFSIITLDEATLDEGLSKSCASFVRVREVELVLARTKTSTREKEEKIDSLQQKYVES